MSGTTWTSKISSIPDSNTSVASVVPVFRSMIADPAHKLVMALGDRDAAEDRCLPDPRQADEGEIRVAGETARVTGHRCDLLAFAVVRVHSLDPAVARVEDQQLVAVPTRRVRHRQSLAQDLSVCDVQNGPGAVFVRAPACGLVAAAEHRHGRRATVAHREPVEVAAVLCGETGDERRTPAGHEAVIGMQVRQAGEQRVDDPQVGLPLSPEPQASSWHWIAPVTVAERAR